MASVGVSRPRALGLPEPDRIVAGLVLASCLVVPLLFVTAIEDSFALPKAVALQVVLAMALAVTALRFAGGLKVTPALSPLDGLVLAFVILNVLAAVFSVGGGRSLLGERLQYQGLITTLVYVGFFYLALVSLRDESRLRLLFVAVAAGGSGGGG